MSGMVESTPERRAKVRAALAGGDVLTSRQLTRRGGSWRTVMHMAETGEITHAGSNGRAQVLYRAVRP